MFFRLSMLLYAFTRPSSLIVVFLVVGLLVRAFAPARFARWGTRLAGLGVALFLVATVTPLGPVLMWALETRIPDAVGPADPAPAGIVLLGGATDGRREERLGHPVFLEGAEAIFEAIRLARRWPNVPIVLTGGGSGGIADDGTDHTEAGSMARLFTEAGIDPARLVLERRARTTWENALYSRDMVHPEPGSRWVLVTQAWHMPRSVGAFRAAGWTVVPHPGAWMTDLAPHWRPPTAEGLSLLDLAVKEFFGLVGYRSTGRSSELWPSP